MSITKQFDSVTGELIKSLRDGMSQADLAEYMRDFGFATWSQATVWNVEKGIRPLRLSEAIGLASVLGVDVDLFTVPNAKALERKRAQQRLREAEELMRQARGRLVLAREEVEATEETP